MSPNETLIHKLGEYVEQRRLDDLPNLFCEDASYNDTVYGLQRGRVQLRSFFPMWHRIAIDYRWRFFDALVSNEAGYACFYFAYTSTHPASEGRRIELLGISHFQFRDGLIFHYEEAANPATALVQMEVSEPIAMKNLRLRAALDRIEIDLVKNRLGIEKS